MPELGDHETSGSHLIKSLSIDRQNACVLRVPAVPGSHQINGR